MPSDFDEAFAAVQSLAKDFDAQKDFYLSPSIRKPKSAKSSLINF